jgi:hypothetical protein
MCRKLSSSGYRLAEAIGLHLVREVDCRWRLIEQLQRPTANTFRSQAVLNSIDDRTAMIGIVIVTTKGHVVMIDQGMTASRHERESEKTGVS